ncbi:MAG: thiamine phosphate synthase [Candidatus Thermoplasmatota archaeon]
MLKKVNYYYITDENSEVPLVEQVKAAVKNGIKMVQYRKKSGTDLEKYRTLEKIKEVCEGKALLIVNDRVDVALAAGADGVHLGQDDLPLEEVREISAEIIIGVSTHDIESARQAEKTADYIAVGPIHETDTKADTAEELGVERANEIAGALEVPTVAIGGVRETDLASLLEAFDMICAISSVTKEGALTERISYFEKKIDEIKRKERR